MNRMYLLITAILLLSVGAAWTQIQVPRGYINKGVIQHHGLISSTVLANDNRPLHQAIEAVRQEYGWCVSYEDPTYFSTADLYDASDRAWRANHPNEPGVLAIKGKFFQSKYPEPLSDITKEEPVLNKIVTDYNESGNPGKFTVRSESDGCFSIVGEYVRDESGRDQLVPSILDTPISIPVQERAPLDTIDLILDQVASATGIKLGISLPMNGPNVKIGATGASARDLLRQTIDSAGGPGRNAWDLYYEASGETYIFNLVPTLKVRICRSGCKELWPVDSIPKANQ